MTSQAVPCSYTLSGVTKPECDPLTTGDIVCLIESLEWTRSKLYIVSLCVCVCLMLENSLLFVFNMTSAAAYKVCAPCKGNRCERKRKSNSDSWSHGGFGTNRHSV